ncbi:MAG TPA: ABC transporter ATP-binding protein [Solirubrobacteraceae bacterium]|jgi:ATP-binding cassette subfamily B protein|nr:ABC transporter ATP-binding protein [Solirubrobacteraceae bacterium]
MRTFRRLLGFLTPYRRGVYWSFALAFGAMGATVLIPYLTGRAINAIRAHHHHTLVVLAIAIGAAALVRLVLSVFRRLVAGRVSLDVEYDLRKILYGHLQRLELGFFDHQQTGQLMSRATVDLQAVRFFLGYGLVFIGQSVLTILLAAVAMFAIKPELAAISLAPVLFVILIADRYGRRSRPALQEVQQRLGELTADAEENVSGVRVVKAFAREDRQRERFQTSATRVFDQAVYATRLEARYTPMISFLPNLGLAAILLVGGREVINGSLNVGDFTAFYAYLLLLITPMQTLGYLLSATQRATASGARIFEILDRAPRITTPDGAPDLPPGDGRVELIHAGLTFEGATHPALIDANLVVEPGTTVALAGTTGSGKTTLVSLLGRLYDATTGSVKIDGADVTSVRLESLRSAIATVNDDPFLFSATVHDNIAYARPDASREAVEEAAHRARADEFIRELPAGYDTRIGERGLTLSGGQRQRIAIARAILADPRILVLDDATSSVDASTEQEIKAALAEVMVGRTTFVISHRLSTIAAADEIVLLDAGRISDVGTHAELLDRSPSYREMVESGLPDDPSSAEGAGFGREAEVAGR